MTTPPPALVIQPVSYAVATSAVVRWHYSQKMPAGRLVRWGVWEDGRFIGVILFGRGATPQLAPKWGMTQWEAVELVRVALRDHVTPVSAVVAAALRRLKAENPGLRLVISFADPAHGHHGGIYQAGNWIYTGTVDQTRYFRIRGKLMHPRSVHRVGWRQSIPWLRVNVDPEATAVDVPPKHRYLMPLDKATRRMALRFSQPYPPRMVDGAAEGSTASHAPSGREGRVQLPPAAPPVAAL